MSLMIRSSLGAMTLSILAIAVGGAPVGAASLIPGDLLVSSSRLSGSSTLREYSPSGSLVQSFTIPAPASSLPTEYGRDIVVDSSGQVQIYNGTFSPVLTTLNPADGSQVSHGGPAGWSTVNATHFGSVATYQNFLYATDMMTAGAGGPNGIIRFDLNDYSATRFGDASTTTRPYNAEYIDINVGANGLLYALSGGGSPQGTTIDVFNPVTMALLQTITLSGGSQSSGIAVGASGDIYSVEAFSGVINHFNANGVLVNSLNTGLSYLQDIDLSNTGQLAVGGRFGDVVLTTTALSTFSHFTAGSDPTFVAFASPLSPVSTPEPGTIVLLGTGVIGILGFSIRRRPGKS